jgi:hypothetical protein
MYKLNSKESLYIFNFEKKKIINNSNFTLT